METQRKNKTPQKANQGVDFLNIVFDFGLPNFWSLGGFIGNYFEQWCLNPFNLNWVQNKI